MKRPTASTRVRLACAVLAAVLLGAAAAPAAAQQPGYVTQVEDLPLMPGLTEVADAGLVFDQPAGRIVEAYAQGQVTREEVLDFYRSALPPLGWKTLDTLRFGREGETLTLDFLNARDRLIVRFSLTPG
ncbi:MAG: hypothetical protein QNJ67_04605 [Kiloniellales bacterium]|nr:hypothetical protein [Kiloniellales bacterium]